MSDSTEIDSGNTMPTIHANALEIGYETAGEGPPLVLVHGATSSGRDNFAHQIPALATLFTVYAPDARGHATTRWDALAGFRAEWLVDDLSAFVEALGVSSIHLLGFSMGAMTALTFAVRYPHRVRTLVVGGVSPLREPRASVARRLMDPVRIDRDDPGWGALLARRHDPVQGPGAWRRLLPAIADDVAIQPLLSPAQLRSIAVPALVACGDRDPFVPVDQAWSLSRQLGDGRLLVVPDCAHDLMPRRPRLVNEALLGFYRSMPSLGSEPTGGSTPDGGAQ
jgi:pimeloyl-ACP methyl ester carboxylesterase